MTDVLAKICAATRDEVARRKAATPLAALEARIAGRPRGFTAALQKAQSPGHPALIAEIKKASPSRGLIRADFDPATLARAYQAGGATCLSVVTDAPFFQGHDDYLRAARAAVALPALRKDFTVDRYQIAETRALGADCILLIVAALSDEDLHAFAREARAFDLDVLVEVHDEDEMRRALRLNDVMVGVNNRNLKTLKVDIATFERLTPMAAGRFLVAESGLRTAADVARVAAAGASAILVGESLMSQPDLTRATRELLARELA